MCWCLIAEANSFIYNLPLQLSSQTSPTLIWLTSFSSFIFLFSRWNITERTLAFFVGLQKKTNQLSKKIFTHKLLAQLFLRSMFKLQQPLLCSQSIQILILNNITEHRTFKVLYLSYWTFIICQLCHLLLQQIYTVLYIHSYTPHIYGGKTPSVLFRLFTLE